MRFQGSLQQVASAARVSFSSFPTSAMQRTCKSVCRCIIEVHSTRNKLFLENQLESERRFGEKKKFKATRTSLNVQHLPQLHPAEIKQQPRTMFTSDCVFMA